MYRSNSYVVSAAAFALTMASSLASAQVKIQMTTAPTPTVPATNCTATTDASGLQLVPGTTDLKAAGVTLNPAGCGGATGVAENFAAAVNVPASTSLNTPFNVTWSASADADTCIYAGAGPVTNVSGWSFGAVACSSSAQCAGTHTVQGVTISASGSYDFGVTCTNTTGHAHGGIAAANNNPPTPDGFGLNVAPSQPAINQPFNVSWSVQNATACTGTVVSGPGPLPGWTTPTDATTGTRNNIVATVAGSYVLKLECSNAHGAISSQPTTVNVGAAPPSCAGPAGLTRLMTSTVKYGQPPYSTGGTRSSVAVTEWNNIWGFAGSGGTTPVSWPGVRGSSAVIQDFGRGKFIAAHFNTGSSPDTLNGSFVYGALTQPNLDIRISTVCGDFSESPANTACLSHPVGNGGSYAFWNLRTTNSTYCHLEANTDYYLNIRPADTTSCTGNSCPIWLTSYPSAPGQ